MDLDRIELLDSAYTANALVVKLFYDRYGWMANNCSDNYRWHSEGYVMTYDECMESNSPEAIRVREILRKQKNGEIPDDLVMYKIFVRLGYLDDKANHA